MGSPWPTFIGPRGLKKACALEVNCRVSPPEIELKFVAPCALIGRGKRCVLERSVFAKRPRPAIETRKKGKFE